GKRTHSLILVANAKHVLTDSWTSFGVVLGLALTAWTGWLPLDPLVAIVVALNIVWSGGKLIRQSVGGLMDEGDPHLEQLIRSTLEAETGKRNLRYHELRYRQGGTGVWVEFHLLFPNDTVLELAHQSATEIEMALANTLPIPARIVSHLEPLEKHQRDHASHLRH
ncbi:MAG: cation diffusion facilitator family transporter, partial [Bacteroidetes bacterium]|nr:cation diffusion facilitator family transporter [Bacteroidota bacterium]